MELENCSSELKDAYRSVYALIKTLDDQKKQLSSINQLFQPDINQKRLALIHRCHSLLFKGHQVIGKKSREILWRKGYYEFIAFIKKNYHKEDKMKQIEWLEKLRNFILEGISNYKRLIIKLEKVYDLDLQLLVDFSIIIDDANESDQNYEKSLMNGYEIDDNDDNIQKSLESVGLALDTIHSSFLSLGDLHRYYLDFKFDNKLTSSSTLKKITKDLAARYYYQAFQLNSTIGMAQNQLGTLFYGQNYDLDSIYHYLYSLICTVPFELSESNVCKLFATHADYLEDLNPDKIEFNLRDFYARFYLIIDIFFFDKNVPDFNNLCHCVLIDLKKILCSKTINIQESSILKIVCILMFCMSKLKMIKSEKVYFLNAFLVAVCSDLIDACIVNLEQYILSKSKQNDEFQEMYINAFNKFETVVRRSREEYRRYYNNKEQTANNHNMIMNGKDMNSTIKKTKPPTKLLYVNDDSCKSQKTTSQEQSGNEKYTPLSLSSGGNHYHQQNNVKNSVGNSSNDGINLDTTTKTMKNSGGESQSKSSTTNQLSNKSNENHNNMKRKNLKLRRRRRHRNTLHSDDDDDDEDENSSYDDSDSELDTDFSSNDDDYDDESDDLSSNFDSDFSDIEDDNDDRISMNDDNDDKNENLKTKNDQQQQNGHTTFSDNEDMVIEEEQIIYPNDPNSSKFIEHFNSMIMNDDVLNFKSENEDGNLITGRRTRTTTLSSSRPQSSIGDGVGDDGNSDDNCLKIISNNSCEIDNKQNSNKEPPIKLKYKSRYTKIDPNIIIEFTKNDITIRALKILFDWLRINNEILIGCYHTNPEFIHKIMKLLNYCNIDIFTRKVYFEREFIKIDNVREKLNDLFEVRSSIPLSEDMILKGFDLLKTTQSTLDWETPIRDHITENEENIMRIFKMVDFAFFTCKLKKFNYSFCSKTRRFTENLIKKKRDNKKSNSNRKRDRKLSSSSSRNHNQINRHNRHNSRRRNDGGYGNKSNIRERMRERGGAVGDQGRRRRGDNMYMNEKRRNSEQKNGIMNGMKGSQNEEENRNCKITSVMPRKGYLRNRNLMMTSDNDDKIQIQQDRNSQSTTCSSDDDKKKRQNHNSVQKTNVEEKCRLMGKLWLKNEVETLEAKVKPMHVILTPFIVVDGKALTEYTGIVKALVKSKQFIVLIPNAVLGELDQLKKQSESARNAIRWLEQEFKVGNRHMRAQRDHESQSLLLIKIPKKLDRESSTFIQIAKFCNFIVTNHSEGSEYEANLVTFLSGDNLNDKKTTNLSFTGILDAIPVRHDQISNFYEKFKKK